MDDIRGLLWLLFLRINDIYGNIEENYKESMEEFKVISAKWCRSMNDLNIGETQLILKYIREYIADVDDNYNFFDNDDWCVQDIQIVYWEWKGKILVDINGFPGDNEDGCIFSDGDIVIINGDRDLVPTKICPLMLADQIPNLSHLRSNGDFNCEKLHAHCIQQHLKYCKEIQRECTCEVCIIYSSTRTFNV